MMTKEFRRLSHPDPVGKQFGTFDARCSTTHPKASPRDTVPDLGESLGWMVCEHLPAHTHPQAEA
jgi:hypothetical protein